MSSAIMSKVWNLFGMDQAEEDEENEDVYDYDYEEEQPEEEKKSFIKKNNKVVSMPQNQSIRMVISQPTSFEQSEEICGFLKEKKSVIVNLEYVLDAHIQKVSNSIFLIAPINYEITNEMAREEIKNKLSVSWLNKNSIN